jgi:DNA helicase-2/ATP-dependent DNA helicase PcrA
MRFIADFHIHSHFSRATSKSLVPEDLFVWAQKKGITVIGTGDFTHAGWLSELQDKLEPAENGLYHLKPELQKALADRIPVSCSLPVRFVLSGEISCIYKRGGRTRKIHNLILMPDFESVKNLNDRLSRIGNLKSDGRPILGLDSRDLLEIVLETTDRSFFIPAHIWTPWFSLFGSKSGFDAMEECFGDLTGHIHALETGLSSDPIMNRRLSALDDYLLVSNSDAHSPEKLGREANLFDTHLDYDSLLKAMTEGRGFEGTVEFFPEEGKYHYDGHRKCHLSLHPSETQRHKGLCPKCGKPVTVGVLHRVYELADREEPKLSKPFYSLIPLTEILSEILGCGPSAKKVTAAYEDLLAALGPELHILMDVPSRDLERLGGPLLSEAVDRMRENRVIREEGYDGEYGVIRLFERTEKLTLQGQAALFDSPAETTPYEEEKELTFSSFPAQAVHEEPEPYQTFLFDPILDPLNPAQTEAVLHQGSHLLIVAGPGTGKTMTLTHRIAYQIRSQLASAAEILCLTFTNKAAAEMRKRLMALVPEEQGTPIKVSTFHAFCLEVLREKASLLGLPPDFGILSETDAGTLARQVLLESKKGVRSASRFLRKLPALKLVSLKENKGGDPLFDLYQAYQLKLRTLGMLDLHDLEVEALRLFQDHPAVAAELSNRFSKIFVDEYQDTNRIQAEILKALVYPVLDLPCAMSKTLSSVEGPLVPSPVSVCAIGDPDQAIYGFRGAEVENFYRFADDFPGAKKVNLLLNYRSTQPILDAASSVMQNKQKLIGVLGIGERVQISDCRTEDEEAETIVEQIEKLIGGTSYFSLDSGRATSQEEHENLGFGEIAVLFRLNAQGDAFEEAFSRAGIPFVRSGEKPLIESYPVDVIWRYLQYVMHPENAYYGDAYRQVLKDHGLTPHPPPGSCPGQALTPPIKGGEPQPSLSSQSILSSRGEDNFHSSSPLTGEGKPFPPSPLVGEDSPKFSSPSMGEDKGGGEVGSTRTIPELIDQAIVLHGLTSLPEEEEIRLRRLRDLAESNHGKLSSFLDTLSLERGIDHAGLLGDRVAIMSLHAAKGLEWPVVFIAGCEDQLLPCTLFASQDEAEEKRLFYVGMTRARSRLVLSYAARRTLNGRPLDMKPSPFTLLIPQNLRQPLQRKPWKPKKKPPNQLQLF